MFESMQHGPGFRLMSPNLSSSSCKVDAELL